MRMNEVRIPKEGFEYESKRKMPKKETEIKIGTRR
jgi:hypothetical protein